VSYELFILIVEALVVYLLVLGAHALRGHYGLAFFYALMGGLTAIMSWVTDAGVSIHVAGITFMVGSTVFYTSLLLGVFVVYVFDGPRATRIAISTVAGVSAMVPLVALALNLQMQMVGNAPLSHVPMPSLRINLSSVVATVADLIFLAMAWEFLGKSRLGLHLWLRAFLTLLGVMWLDVFLFATSAFAGKPEYFNIMKGTLVSRLIISLFAFPLLYSYLNWQKAKKGLLLENRPVLAILKEVAEVRLELTLAQQEIEHRKKAEAEKAAAIVKLEATLLRVQHLEGLLPICSSCRQIRVDSGSTEIPDRWMPLETYLYEESRVQFSHGICPSCEQRLYPVTDGEKLGGTRV
jgi:uncharacterized PurR-regulated membrane protein YhhQ (DUF165 family)